MAAEMVNLKGERRLLTGDGEYTIVGAGTVQGAGAVRMDVTGGADVEITDHAHATVAHASRVLADGEATVSARYAGRAWVTLRERAAGEFWGHAHAMLTGSTSGSFYDASEGLVKGSAHANARGRVSLTLEGNASATLHEHSRASGTSRARVTCFGGSHVDLTGGGTRAILHGTATGGFTGSTVVLYDGARADVSSGADVTAGGRSIVTSWGADMLTLDDSATAHAMHRGACVALRGSAVLFVHKDVTVTVTEAGPNNVIVLLPWARALGDAVKNAMVVEVGR